MENIIVLNDKPSWEKYYSFAHTVLANPTRGGKKNTSLAAIINKRVIAFEQGTATVVNNPKPKPNKKRKESSLDLQVSAKLGIGDFKGAVRLVSSKDVVLKPTPEIISKLRDKHPPLHKDAKIPLFQALEGVICDVSQLKKAIGSFPNGSGGGPDGLLPQHIKDCSEESMGGQSTKFLETLVKFYNNIVFPGKIPVQACHVFFGANLIALSKPDGGIRPIAVGMTLRRLASKVIMEKLSPRNKELFWPHQVGVGAKLGAEIAVHSVRKFIGSPTSSDLVCLKTDFSNAYNTLRRDIVLEDVLESVPQIFSYIWQAYAKSTYLFLGEQEFIMSQEGVQQGDPLGPFLYALTTMAITRKCKSSLNIWYLDDGFIGGRVDDVLSDYKAIKETSESLGLVLNPSKCELFKINPSSTRVINSGKEFPGVKEIGCQELKLLGAPILPEANEDALAPKLDTLRVMTERLKLLKRHDALFLLRQCFAMPKIMYLIRTAPIYRNTVWCEEFDETIRKSLQEILNVDMEGSIWAQSSLPVHLGGLGIRRVSEVALPAYLSSVCATSFGVEAMVSAEIYNEVNPFYESAKLRWLELAGPDINPPTSNKIQKEWDLPLCKLRYDRLLQAAPSDKEKARLLAVGSKNAGDWLLAFPISSMGLKLDDRCLQISCALRLGATICRPHKCFKCCKEVDSSGTHGLSCSFSVGRHPRHNRVNYLIKRALGNAGFNSNLEPENLSNSVSAQGLVPDGVTIQTYKNGKALIWDFTCHDTVAPSYLLNLAIEAGKVAFEAEKGKDKTYAPLTDEFHFEPICVETLGVWGEKGHKFIKNVGRLIKERSKDKRSSSFLFQAISMEVQKGNCASVLGTVESPKLLQELFDILDTKPDFHSA